MQLMMLLFVVIIPVDIEANMKYIHKYFVLKPVGITINKTNLSIHIGEVSGDGFICSANHVWRVNPDGALRDTFGNLRRVFMMPEIEFFKHYAKEAASHHEYLDSLNQEIESVKAQIPELPFSNIWMAQHMVDKVPAGSEIHLVFIIVFVLGTSLNSLLVFRQNAM